MIELLVTIIIAGIAFAALVPVFVGAEQKAAGDSLRNVALNVAQDRIEKIRALSFDDITVENLESSTFAGGQFGTTWTTSSGTGSTKTLDISYSVTDGGSGLAATKQVSVTVTWTAPPSPVKPAELTTIVSNQYAGPQITNLTLSPVDDGGDVTGVPVTMTATLSSSDAADMESGSYVVFGVYSSNGTELATSTISTGDAGNSEAGVYVATWAASDAADGRYTFTAQAFSASGDAGNIWSLTTDVTASGAPPQVTGLEATAGDGRVVLTWTACTASDFASYEVYRGTTSGGESLLVSDLTATGYTDTGLTNDTTYYYQVYAVDTDGNVSVASDEVSATPTDLPDDTRPTQPGSFAATASLNTAVLTWTASTDSDDGVAGYYIYRSDATTPYAVVDADSTSFTDTIGWSTTYSYYVRAYDTVGRQSEPTATISVTTGTAPTYNLTVRNSGTATISNVYVVSATTGLYWVGNTNPSTSQSTVPTLQLKKNKSAVWYALPYDTYTVRTSGGTSTSVVLSSATTVTVTK